MVTTSAPQSPGRPAWPGASSVWAGCVPPAGCCSRQAAAEACGCLFATQIIAISACWASAKGLKHLGYKVWANGPRVLAYSGVPLRLTASFDHDRRRSYPDAHGDCVVGRDGRGAAGAGWVAAPGRAAVLGRGAAAGRGGLCAVSDARALAGRVFHRAGQHGGVGHVFRADRRRAVFSGAAAALAAAAGAAGSHGGPDGLRA